MKAENKLYQIYLSQCENASDAPDKLMEFLQERLSEEDYLDAEEIVTEALIQMEEAAFCLGCTYLPNLIKGLLEE